MAKKKGGASARVALNLDKLTVAEKVALGRALAAALAANAATFSSPPVAAAALKGAADALDQGESAAKAARQTAMLKTSQRDDAEAALEHMLTSCGKYVDLVADGNATVIGQASLQVRGTPVRTKSAPGAPGNLVATSGAKPGEAKLSFERPAGATSFVVQFTATPTDTASYKMIAEGNKTRLTATGLPAGRGWFQVAAHGAQGQGAWSDPATCIVS